MRFLALSIAGLDCIIPSSCGDCIALFQFVSLCLCEFRISFTQDLVVLRDPIPFAAQEIDCEDCGFYREPTVCATGLMQKRAADSERLLMHEYVGKHGFKNERFDFLARQRQPFTT